MYTHSISFVKRLIRLSFFGFFLFAFSFQTLAQIRSTRQVCGSSIDWNTLRADVNKLQKFQKTQHAIAERVSQLRLENVADVNAVFEIPVVFHIVDPNPSSITDAAIVSQLDVLNESYAGTNADSVNSFNFYNVRGHTKIIFLLAKRSPNGCNTNGITRTVSNLSITNETASNIKHSATGGIDIWDSFNTKYLNIWVGNFGAEPDDGGVGNGIATPPDESDPLLEQGVVINKTTFSFTNDRFTNGKILVHEIGHFLNLRHIWGDAAGCSIDDGINDTPKQDTCTFGGPISISLELIIKTIWTIPMIRAEQCLQRCRLL